MVECDIPCESSRYFFGQHGQNITCTLDEPCRDNKIAHPNGTVSDIDCNAPCVDGKIAGSEFGCHQAVIDNLPCIDDKLLGTELACERPCHNVTVLNFGSEQNLTCWYDQSCEQGKIYQGEYLTCERYAEATRGLPCINGTIKNTADACRIMVDTSMAPAVPLDQGVSAAKSAQHASRRLLQPDEDGGAEDEQSSDEPAGPQYLVDRNFEEPDCHRCLRTYENAHYCSNVDTASVAEYEGKQLG